MRSRKRYPMITDDSKKKLTEMSLKNAHTELVNAMVRMKLLGNRCLETVTLKKGCNHLTKI